MGGHQSRADVLELVLQGMRDATDVHLPSQQRVRAVTKLEGLCHDRFTSGTCQTALAEPQRIGELLALLLERELQICAASFQLVRTVTSTRDLLVKEVIGKRVMEDLLELMGSQQPPEILENLLSIVANLLDTDACRHELERASRKNAPGGVKALVMYLDHINPRVQLAALKALNALAHRKSGRQCILTESVLAVVGLCFVETLYGDIRYHAVKLLASLSKQAELRSIIGPRGVIFRLTQTVTSGNPDPLLSQLLASVYCNFTTSDTHVVEPSKLLMMVYSLLCADNLDSVVQGLWALANALSSPPIRRELIETDGLKMIFSVLKHSQGEPQIWYEAGRILATLAGGGPVGAGAASEEEQEYLIREGSVEAIVAIYDWCLEEVRESANRGEPMEEAADQLVCVAASRTLFDSDGNNIASSTRFMCMSVCTRALRHLTENSHVCHLLMELKGLKPIVHVLKADWDTEAQEHAACVVANLALHPDPCHALVARLEVVPCLVDLLKFSMHDLIHKATSSAIASIGNSNGQFLREIITAGGTSALIGVLQRPGCSVATATHVVRALGLLDTNDAKVEILHKGGLPHVMKHAASECPLLRGMCARALRSLSEVPEDALLLMMVNEGVFGSLMSLLTDDDMLTLREAAHAVALLTRLESNKMVLIGDSIEAVIGHLATTDRELTMSVLSIVGNLSSVPEVVFRIPHLDTVIRQICYVLQMNSFSLTLQAMRCLVGLTKFTRCTATVLATLPAAMFIDMTLSHHTTLQMHAVNVVTNLAMDPQNWRTLREAQITHVLSSLFSSDNFDVILQAVQCMGYMVADPICQKEVLSDGLLISMLTDVAKKAADVAIQQQKSSDGPQMSAFVATRNLLMLEHVLGALKRFSGTEEGAAGIVDMYGCLPMLFECLDCHTLEVRKEAAGCLAILSRQREQCTAIIEGGGVDKVVQALRSATAHLGELETELVHISKRLGMARKPDKPAEDDDGGGQQHVFKLFEQREDMVHSMNTHLKTARLTLQMQISCLMLMESVVGEGSEKQEMVVQAYDWAVFLAPLSSRDKYCQDVAGRVAFTLMRSGVNLAGFMSMGGIAHLLNLLESDDTVVKELAADGLAQLSTAHPAAFRAAIVQEGGVKRVMELTESTVSAIRLQAYNGIAELSHHTVLATELVSQGVVSALRQYSSKSKYRPDTQCLIIRIVGTLASHTEMTKSVLDKGGAYLLFQSLSHFDVSVVTAAADQLLRLGRAEGIADTLCKCKLAPSVVDAVNRVFSPDILVNLLGVTANMCEVATFRDRVAKPQLVDGLLRLIDDNTRVRELSKRCTQAAQTRDETIKDATSRKVSMAPDIGATFFGPNTVSKKLYENMAASALACIKKLLLVQSIVDHLVKKESRVIQVVQSASEKSSPERVHYAAAILNTLLESDHAHTWCLKAGVVSRLAAFSKHQDDPTRLLVAQCFESLTRTAARDTKDFDQLLERLEDTATCKGIMMLLCSTSRDVRLCLFNVLKPLMGHGARELLRQGLVTSVLPMLDSDHEVMQLQALDVISLACPELSIWFADPSLDLAQNARDQCNPSISKIMDVYRRSPQRSKASVSALHTLNTVLLAAPRYLCNLIDGVMLLDLKKAVMQTPRRGSPPRIVYGKSSIEVQRFVDAKGELEDMGHAEVKIQAARLLCFMSSGGTQGVGCLVQVLKVLSLDDMVKCASTAFMEGYDERFLVMILRLAARTTRRSSHKMILAQDRTGLLKNLFALTTHTSPLVVQPAIHIIAKVSEEPSALSRVLTLSTIQDLASTVMSLVQSLLSVDALVPGTMRCFDSGLQATVMHIIIDYACIISNLSDGMGTNFMRSLKEAGDTLKEVILTLPRQCTAEAKLYIMSAVTVLDGTTPQNVNGVMLPPDEYIHEAQDRVDNNRVLAGVQALCTLAKDASCHEQLIDHGAIQALCGVLKNPTPAVFRGACWALSFLLLGSRDAAEYRDKSAKERTKAMERRANILQGVAEMICNEGIGHAAKIAVSHKDHESARAAAKLLTLLLRFPSCRDAVQQATSSPLLPVHFQ